MDEKKNEIKENKKEEIKKEEKVKEAKVEKAQESKKEEVKVEKDKETKKKEKKAEEPKVETKKVEKKTEEPKTENKKFEVKKEKTNTKKNTWIGKLIVIIAVLAIAILLTFMIVTSSDPKKSVDGFFTNLQSGDFEKAQEFMTGEELLDDIEYNAETQRLFFDKISWKVKKVTEEDDTATVEVEITNKDFKTIISNYMQKVLKLALSGEDITEEGIENYFVEELKNDQVQTTTQTKTIQLIKEDKKWKVVSNDELIDSLLPGLQESIESLSN